MKGEGAVDMPNHAVTAESADDGLKSPMKVKSGVNNSLSLKRIRHHCILISDVSANDHQHINDNMSQLTLNIPASSQLSTDVPCSKARSMSTSLQPGRQGEGLHSSSKPPLSIQRSLSLQEFADDALPDMTSNGTLDLNGTPTPSPKSPRIGSVLTRRSSFIQGKVFTPNDFIIGETIGFGFFGKAIKVHHKETGELMVMKELIHCDEEGKKTFLKEAALLRGLSHPKLLKYIGFLYKGRDLHIITEYIPCGTLETLLHSSDKILSLLQKLRIGIDIASAMEYLHSQQVIHRDLNSPNCLLREDESVVVSDFGLSRLVIDSQKAINESQKSGDCKDSPKLHRIRKKRYTVVGNPYWMAPEMFRGEQYDEKVDVFSFGIILCEVIGQVRADPDFLPRLSNFAVDKESFVSKYCQDCPNAFLSIAFQCCQLTSDDRPSFEVLHKNLLDLYTNHSVKVRKLGRASLKP